MDPLTLSLLTAGLGAVAGGTQDYMSANQLFGKTDEARLKELQRREELGTLGYTADEQREIMRSMLNPLQARERERAVETRSLLSGGGGDVTASFISNLIQGDKGEAARAAASEDLLKAQAEERRAQKKEMDDLAKKQESERAAKQEAILGSIFKLGGGVLGAYEQDMLRNEQLLGQLTADAKAAGKPPPTSADVEEAAALRGWRR